MNEPSITRGELGQFQEVIEEANRGYLRESRVNDRPAFNILRVLAAFRLLLPHSPQPIYNAILFLTKHYDPQTFYQWKKAIDTLQPNSFKAKNNLCRPQIAAYTKTYQNSFNRSRLNDNYDHQQSKSYAQIKIPHELSYSNDLSEDHKDQSRTNAETGKRHLYTKADSTSHLSKNHYVSFEPYRHCTGEEKENINSTNVDQSRKKSSSFQYIQAMQRDLNRTAKSHMRTPIDQSFIKHINSSQSPLVYRQEVDPVEEQMNSRAETFYRFSMQLKVFSSLQANSYVFLRAKEDEAKARLFQSSQLAQKVFAGLLSNVSAEKIAREKESKADGFHLKKIYSRIFGIFKVVFQLRKSGVNREFCAQKLNRRNYEFILNMLLALHSREEGLMDLQGKIGQLIDSDESKKLYMIVKYFGKHSWMSQKNVEDLLNNYKLSIYRSVFSHLRKEQQNNKKFSAIRELNLKRQSFFSFKLRWSSSAYYKQLVSKAVGKHNRRILEKIMKVMLSTVYSTKLYSKRCEYIERSSKLALKQRSLKLWVDKARESKEKSNAMKQKGSVVMEKMQKFIKRVVINKIREAVGELDSRIAAIKDQNIIHRKRIFFNFIKFDLQQTRKLKEAETLFEKMQCRLSVNKWKESTKKGKAISKIVRTVKVHYFRQLVLPSFEDCIVKMRQVQCSEQGIMRKIFEGMKQYHFQEVTKREILRQNCQQMMIYIKKQRAFSAVTKYSIVERERRLREEILTKSEKLINLDKLRNQQLFMHKLRSFWSQRETLREKSQNLGVDMNFLYERSFYNRMRELGSLRRDGAKLQQLLQQNRSTYITKRLLIRIDLLKCQKIMKMRKNNSSKAISQIIHSLCMEDREKKERADNFNRNIIKQKTIMGLKLIVRQFHQATSLAQKSSLRKQRDCIKDRFIEHRRMLKVKKLHNRTQNKAVFSYLSEACLAEKEYANFLNWRSQRLKKQFLINLRQGVVNRQSANKITLKIDHCQKVIAVSRLNNFYVAKLISKKHLYMALKFRAFKLCASAFQALRCRNKRVYGHKAKERLSTDIGC